jgi:hypothetical protein
MPRSSRSKPIACTRSKNRSPRWASTTRRRIRFLVTHQQYRDVKQTLAVLSVDLEKFIKASQEWRTMHRNWILLIGVVAILTFAIVVALGTAMYIGGLPK